MPVYTGIYKHIPVHTGIFWYVLVCTGMYWYVLGYTGMYQSRSEFKNGANQIQTRNLLHTFDMRDSCTARVQTPNTGYGTYKSLC